jgi:hypothetical protein
MEFQKMIGGIKTPGHVAFVVHGAQTILASEK